jgi:hypothetical protein
VLFGAEIAEHFIPARVGHGGGFAQLARILEFAHRRMVARDLANAPGWIRYMRESPTWPAVT